jgi:hypothetical protein
LYWNPIKNDLISRNHEHHKVRIDFSKESSSATNGELWGLVELAKTGAGEAYCNFSFRAYEDLVASAAKYFKLHLRTLTALNCSLLLETFAQGTFKDKLPITHAPGLLVIFTCLSETDFSSVAARGTFKKVIQPQRSEEYIWSSVDSCAFMKDGVIMNKVRRNRRLVFARSST